MNSSEHEPDPQATDSYSVGPGFGPDALTNKNKGQHGKIGGVSWTGQAGQNESGRATKVQYLFRAKNRTRARFDRDS